MADVFFIQGTIRPGVLGEYHKSLFKSNSSSNKFPNWKNSLVSNILGVFPPCLRETEFGLGRVQQVSVRQRDVIHFTFKGM